MDGTALTTRQKASALNLDATKYGTFAEIGSGQEVARWFFSVGGGAGTVAKTVFAHDTAVSDGLYGPAKQYVSRQRLEAMLEQEFTRLRECLDGERGDAKCFFAFADTLATGSPQSAGVGRAWIGVRFQAHPHDEPSQIIALSHLFESAAERQQGALGVLGVNLIYGAFCRRDDPADLIASLMDDLSCERIAIDTIKLSGPAFQNVDNQLMTLQLVEQGLDPVVIEERVFSAQPDNPLNPYRKASWIACSWDVRRRAGQTPWLQ